jgi:hypothetical protein
MAEATEIATLSNSACLLVSYVQVDTMRNVRLFAKKNSA